MGLQNFFKFREIPDTESAKPFVEHLEDLRWTVVKMAITIFVAMILCFLFRGALTTMMQRPLDAVGQDIRTLQSLSITDSLTISFSLAFYAGIVISFPILLYFLAEFVLPALTLVEKKLLLPAIGASFALFIIGVLGCYYWLLPTTIGFFLRDAQSLGWMPAWTVREYYSFVTRFTIAFGVAFELPILVLVLVRFGVLTFAVMQRTRPFAIVIIFVSSALITPPDPLTMIAMGLPVYLLYESCIWIAWFMQRKKARADALEK
ncbi:twin-arginine translocase subunit TatC [soil metagenome]|nr:twin-arginine translocase subunit TatC [Chthoniobacterales bacterium]